MLSRSGHYIYRTRAAHDKEKGIKKDGWAGERRERGERREEITPAHRLWPVAKCAVHGQLHEHYRHTNYTTYEEIEVK
jgi:hypothetical protein